MIVGMGDICDYLIESFEETKASRMERPLPGDTHRGVDEAAPGGSLEDTDPRVVGKYALAALSQIRSWLEDGCYLEAALACLKLEETVGHLDSLAEAYGKPGSYHSLQVLRMKKQLRDIPRDVLAHAVRAVSKGSAVLPAGGQGGSSSQGGAASLTLCCQCVVALSLLHKQPVGVSLGLFLAHQTAVLRTTLAKPERLTPEGVTMSISMLYATRAFVYRVFVEQSTAIGDALTVTHISTLRASMASNRDVMVCRTPTPTPCHVNHITGACTVRACIRVLRLRSSRHRVSGPAPCRRLPFRAAELAG